MIFTAVYATASIGSEQLPFVGCVGSCCPQRLIELNEGLFDMNRSMHFPMLPVEAIPKMESNHWAEQNLPVDLVVDDERAIADSLSAILGRNGSAAMTAYDAPSALEIATRVPPHLLISDVMMPLISGIDLAVAIRHTVPDCEVILFSGQPSTADLLATARLAGHDIVTLSKPVHPTEVLAQVTERLALRKESPAN